MPPSEAKNMRSFERSVLDGVWLSWTTKPETPNRYCINLHQAFPDPPSGAEKQPWSRRKPPGSAAKLGPHSSIGEIMTWAILRDLAGIHFVIFQKYSQALAAHCFSGSGHGFSRISILNTIRWFGQIQTWFSSWKYGDRSAMVSTYDLHSLSIFWGASMWQTGIRMRGIDPNLIPGRPRAAIEMDFFETGVYTPNSNLKSIYRGWNW